MGAPKLDGDAIWANLNALHRAPFTAILANAIGAEPTEDELKKFAAKSPDRWAQLIAIFGRLSGFTEKTEIRHAIHDYSAMSDAELQQAIQDMEAEDRQGGADEDQLNGAEGEKVDVAALATLPPQGEA